MKDEGMVSKTGIQFFFLIFVYRTWACVSYTQGKESKDNSAFPCKIVIQR